MKLFKQKYTTLMALMASTAIGGALLAEEEAIVINPPPSQIMNRSDICEYQPVCCTDSGRFFVGADLLYWKTHVTGLELDFGTTSISEVITDGVEVMTTNEFDADPHFKWNAGYRIAAGYQFACSDWEIGAIWTHFQDSGTRSINEDADTVNTTKCSIKFNQIDVLLAYQDTLACSLKIKPYVGVRGVKIREGLNAFLVTDLTISPATLATETRSFDDSQRYWGVGPILGLQGDWDLGCGFSVYGAAAASLLYGKYKLNYDDSDIFSAPIDREIFSTATKHLHGFDCNIDLALGLCWRTCVCDSYDLSLKLGFEHHQFFNQSHLGANRGDLTFDGGIFSVGLAL